MSGANVSHVVNLVYLELTDANTMVELWSDRCVLKWKRGGKMAGCNYCSHSVSRIRSGEKESMSKRGVKYTTVLILLVC